MKLVLENSLTSIEDCEWTKKELELIFSPNQVYSIYKSAIKKSLHIYKRHIFFFQIYTTWKILIGFAYSFIPVGFRAILMLFLSFLSQKIYPAEFVKPEVLLSRRYLRKCSIWPGAPSVINFSKNAIISEPLGFRN